MQSNARSENDIFAILSLIIVTIIQIKNFIYGERCVCVCVCVCVFIINYIHTCIYTCMYIINYKELRNI